MYALIGVLGCTAALVPGEEVLGVERAATFVYGSAGARLGAAVAGRGDDWLAAAPGAGETWEDGAASDLPAVWVGWWGEQAIRVDTEGTVFVDGAARWSVPGARAWAAGDAGVLAGTERELHFVDQERTVPVAGLQAVAWGTDRVLGVVCGDDGCEARAWDADGVGLGAWAEAGDGGAVGEWDGVAWAGDPAWEQADGAGRVCAEDGTTIAGEVGDHLGAAIGGGYTVGTFNKWVVPARARVVPLGGGVVLDLEAGAESQPIALGGDATLVVGAPYQAAHGVPSGAVVVVR